MLKRIKVPEGKGDELETPPWLWQQLDDVFTFDWDAASTKHNNLAGKPHDCIKDSWLGRGYITVYMNPPYSKPEKFLSTAAHYSLLGITTVALIKGDPSTRWWNSYVKPFAQIKWIPKRLRFWYKDQPTEHMANFPSVLAFYWGFPNFNEAV